MGGLLGCLRYIHYRTARKNVQSFLRKNGKRLESRISVYRSTSAAFEVIFYEIFRLNSSKMLSILRNGAGFKKRLWISQRVKELGNTTHLRACTYAAHKRRVHMYVIPKIQPPLKLEDPLEKVRYVVYQRKIICVDFLRLYLRSDKSAASRLARARARQRSGRSPCSPWNYRKYKLVKGCRTLFLKSDIFTHFLSKFFCAVRYIRMYRVSRIFSRDPASKFC